MSFMRILGLIVWLAVCGGGFTALNVTDAYRDRGMTDLKTDLSVKTLNGDSTDFANLAASKEVESSSRIMITVGRLVIIVVCIGGVYYIVSTSRKKEEETA